MESIRERYGAIIKNLVSHMPKASSVSDANVYQQGQSAMLPAIDKIIEEQLLPGSGISGMENLERLLGLAEAGESCLLLMEHYSNFDLPAFHYFLRKAGGVGSRVADALVAIAGIKLNEDNPLVSAFANAYSRIIIYPSRSLEIIKNNFKDPNKILAEVMRGNAINRAAMHALAEIKKQGKLVLVFPAGTRFRPWQPETKRGVREISSYLKSFGHFCLVAINGNIFRLNRGGEMTEDTLHHDKLVYTVGPIHNAADFVQKMKHEHRFMDDKKQAMVDHVMAELEGMHEAVEETRLGS